MSTEIDIDSKAPAPLRAILYCPKCARRHTDEGEWATLPHRRHQCAYCRFRWIVEPLCVGTADEAHDTQRAVVVLADKLVNLLRMPPEELGTARAGRWQSRVHGLTEELHQALLDHDRAELVRELAR